MKKIILALIIISVISASLFIYKNNQPKKTVVNEPKKKVSTPKKQAKKPEVKKQNILLVNKQSKLSGNYIPQNLRTPNVKFISSSDPNVNQMESEAATGLENMFNAASKDGLTLLAVSGYRPYSYQQKLYNEKVARDGKAEADKYVAEPGTSEHQTGLAMDLLSTEYSSLDDGFMNTNSYKWLQQNCGKYGFIIRYPKDKENITKYNFEPWHVRYIGLPASQEIMNRGITLEEYLAEQNTSK
ncbi:D-alanyl-D-alanine carboxypeptidase [Clostridium acetobutylicum]|uniref:D-alanyl-D-alanine carboxypeptidase family hydrolase, YODJ B.subtilis ortholog n=1 Tax=Clostridium acetobutylicum (strain ATCC 824 / DSM 792 / JCM 1419 / IAM 19013 / LMG 5710 / NBRC 13948 / NRRL B-527 / VKM B-1787 / 2291 / W) TaxID=272562 RepID=Q97E20_CLOAB|nr:MULTISPECIES: D-Ala-D-Ala carboxypeptidase VanY [Clostridium]AAK81230.1 D-alanyl-D-alanine carboxypeptidase family hydrolase, YODJ B.subtilis ortholog [Clostridium acetobutylicum ATCC 824]ADZ22336.1 D-alanyl-D-alanine carboxypeptidase family hydrolase, YODJ [Clostridium acetobutylicum EA 2018]AEI33827.1 D-alanyl-D-alanine carboxypeptidase [Clostridium acetobutylicum DSM 1731]AWV81101.1 D-Ala-D-Ala carboxypeptidase VanY [Clostridium acetobutylicum]MBC2395698.1 D-Ala-D-Ala carboxypeptidase Va